MSIQLTRVVIPTPAKVIDECRVVKLVASVQYGRMKDGMWATVSEQTLEVPVAVFGKKLEAFLLDQLIYPATPEEVAVLTPIKEAVTAQVARRP